MKISEMSDDDRKEYLDKAYQAALDMHADGDLDEHPSHTVVKWAQAGRARDENSGLGPKTIQRHGTPESEQSLDDENMLKNPRGIGDNPPEFPGKPANPKLGKPAQDGVLTSDYKSDPVFVTGAGGVLTGDAAILAAARAIDPRKVAGMASVIPSYKRLR